jgi:hypothetical protein
VTNQKSHTIFSLAFVFLAQLSFSVRQPSSHSFASRVGLLRSSERCSVSSSIEKGALQLRSFAMRQILDGLDD